MAGPYTRRAIGNTVTPEFFNELQEGIEEHDAAMSGSFEGIARLDPGEAILPGMRSVPDGVGGQEIGDAELVNVREYGIVGSGNERGKIQALVDAIRSGSQKRRVIYFPEGTYQIDDSIVMTETADVVAGQTRWQGADRNRSVIEFVGTANKPIILYANDYGTYGTDFADLTLRYANRPVTANTQRYGIQIRSDAEGDAPSGGGVYLSVFDRLIFDNCYVGVGEYGTGSGTMPFWSCHFRDITLFHTKMHAFKFQSGGGTIGHPNIVLDTINILNYDQGTMGTGDGVRNDGPAIIATGMTGMSIYNLNIEDWWNRHLQLTGGSFVSIHGIRLERARLDEAYPVMFTLNNNVDIVTGVDLGGIWQKTGLDFGCIFDFYGSQAVVTGVVGSGRDGSNSDVDKVMYGLQCDPASGGSIVADGFRPQGQLTTHNTGSNNSMSIRRLNGNPPVITLAALPTVSAYYAGATVIHRVSNVDTLKMCVQTGASAWAWRTMTLA